MILRSLAMSSSASSSDEVDDGDETAALARAAAPVFSPSWPVASQRTRACCSEACVHIPARTTQRLERTSTGLSAHVNRAARIMNHCPIMSASRHTCGERLAVPPRASSRAFDSICPNAASAASRGTLISHTSSTWFVYLRTAGRA